MNECIHCKQPFTWLEKVVGKRIFHLFVMTPIKKALQRDIE
jgi:hypothetical protein